MTYFQHQFSANSWPNIEKRKRPRFLAWLKVLMTKISDKSEYIFSDLNVLKSFGNEYNAKINFTYISLA